MKKMSKFLAVLLALVLCVSLVPAAFAATSSPAPGSQAKEPSVKVPDTLEGHNMNAYQIFTGTQAVSGNDTLASIEWGNGVNTDAFLAALKDDENGVFGDAFESCNTAADVAKVLSDFGDDSDKTIEFAKLAYQHRANPIKLNTEKGNMTTDLREIGYYLIADESTNLGEGESANALVLQVNEPVEIKLKQGVPTPDKEVYEETGTKWGDAADWDIGDEVPFKLHAKLPGADDTGFANAWAQYKTYVCVSHLKASLLLGWAYAAKQ